MLLSNRDSNQDFGVLPGPTEVPKISSKGLIFRIAWRTSVVGEDDER
jgi:hypothetical protein